MKFQMNTMKTYAKKTLTKKTVALALAGAFAVTGLTTALQPQVFAATSHKTEQNQHMQCPAFNPDEFAQSIQDRYSIDKQTILDLNKQGWKMQDLNRAAFIAYATEKSINDVLDAKTASNNWRDVSETFGLTREQARTTMQTMHAKYMAQNLKIDESTVKSLLKEGYHPRDIAMAATIANQSGKSLNDVLDMKKINNNWSDIAKSLGIEDDAFKTCMDQARNGLGNDGKQGQHNFHHGRGGNGPMMNPGDCPPDGPAPEPQE